MRIYLSGPMRSEPDMGRTAFARAAAALRGQGHVVYAPTEEDGGDAREGDAVRLAFAEGMDRLCCHADGVVVLPGWRSSRGARAEVSTALALDIPVWPLTKFLLGGEDAPRIASSDRMLGLFFKDPE
ncbi:DUF4406 domain-containing protein [Actinomadura formosensis]|uniref:DUF4406 domain-containing protein n=1 Tax=Actinomadura formosensis TaxID=60706 RepID=UPI003D920567